jgi:predicted dehydrogenase
MTWRVAVIGAGKISKKHMDAIEAIPQLALAAIADLDQERASSAALRYNARWYTSYEEMIDTEKPDIAVINLPHFLHRKAALFCISRGCHLMLEKPMALNTAECEELNRAAEQAGVRLMVGHTQHYIAANRKAKELLDSGEFGRLVMIHDRRHMFYDQEDRPDWFFDTSKAGSPRSMRA